MLALSALLFAGVATATNDMVITPYGRRLRQCVLEVESGSHIQESANGLLISQKQNGVTLSSYEHIVPAECHTDGFVEAQRLKQFEKRRNGNKYKRLGEGPVPDGWLDNAGSYPLGQAGNISHFSGTYTVPGDPAADNGQVLFYFLGMQDNNYAAVNIIQPVLTWGNGVKGWNLASWDCCPKNITVQSKTITGFGAGDQIRGTMQRVNSDTWSIDSTIVKSGANTTLVPQVGTYLYDWADVTLEVYSTTTCPEFAKGPMQFTGLSLLGPTNNALNPTWSLTGATGCTGSIKQSGLNFNITHSQS
jgi:hypothetical protein